jgi:ADP-ribose pyrophosphatase YjhB (NUDIX family)
VIGSLRSGWHGRLPLPAFALTAKLVPIPCIDLLPYRVSAGAVEIGLIQRQDAAGVKVWNLVGGGIHRQEPLDAAAARHLETTLGPDISWERADFSRPEMIGEYLPVPGTAAGYDPRKHAIGMSYTVALAGEVSPRGEALDFRWFSRPEIPFSEIGFGQGYVIRGLAEKLSAS